MFVPVWKYLASKIILKKKEYKKFIFPYPIGHVRTEEEIEQEIKQFDINPFFSLFELNNGVAVALINSEPFTFVYIINDEKDNILAVEHDIINEVASAIRKWLKTNVVEVAKPWNGYNFFTERPVGFGYKNMSIMGTKMGVLLNFFSVLVRYEKINFLMMKKIESEYKESWTNLSNELERIYV